MARTKRTAQERAGTSKQSKAKRGRVENEAEVVQDNDEESQHSDDHTTPGNRKLKSLESTFVRVNPYGPSLTEEKSKIAEDKQKNIQQFLEDDHHPNYEEFPHVVEQNYERNLETCMICEQVVDLKGHFELHVLRGEAKQDEYYDFLAYSRQKKFQLCANPSITIAELSSAVRKGVDAVADMMVLRGITITEEKGEFEDPEKRLKCGTHFLQHKIPSKDGEERRSPAVRPKFTKLPNGTTKCELKPYRKLDETYQKEWTARFKAIFHKKAHSNKGKAVDITKVEWLQKEEGSLGAALSSFKTTEKDFFPYGFIPNEHIEQAQIAFRTAKLPPYKPNSIEIEPDTKALKQLKQVKRLPRMEALNPKLVMEMRLEEIDNVFDGAMHSESKRILVFYALLTQFFCGKLQKDDLKKAIKCLTQTLQKGILGKIQKGDPDLEAFYADKAVHLNELKAGRPQAIYGFDLSFIANFFAINILVSLEYGKSSSTYAVPREEKEGTSNFKNKEGTNISATICFAMDDEKMCVFRTFCL